MQITLDVGGEQVYTMQGSSVLAVYSCQSCLSLDCCLIPSFWINMAIPLLLCLLLLTLITQGQAISIVPATWKRYGYLFNITVGTPAQQLTVLSDWTWVSLFVRSGRCEDIYNPSLCVAPGQAYFDERASVTFANTSLPQLTWPVTAFSSNFTVDYGSDAVCTGSICASNVTFQVSDFPYPGSSVPVQPFGGIYGLAPVTPDLNVTFYPAFYQAWKHGAFDNPQIGWNSCQDMASKQACLGGDAKFVFGSTDTTLYRQDMLQWYSVVDPTWLAQAFYPFSPPKSNYWAAPWTGGWIVSTNGSISPNYAVRFPKAAVLSDSSNSSNSESISSSVKRREDTKLTPLAVLDEGSEGLGIPLSARAYADLVRRTHAVKAGNDTVAAITSQGTSSPTAEGSQEWYTVDCTHADTFPSVVYEIDGRVNYTLGPESYVQEISGTGKCYLNVNSWKYSRTKRGDATVIVLGVAFLKKLYVVLDFDKVAFGFAPLT